MVNFCIVTRTHYGANCYLEDANLIIIFHITEVTEDDMEELWLA